MLFYTKVLVSKTVVYEVIKIQILKSEIHAAWISLAKSEHFSPGHAVKLKIFFQYKFISKGP